jgi:LysM repeat protein
VTDLPVQEATKVATGPTTEATDEPVAEVETTGAPELEGTPAGAAPTSGVVEVTPIILEPSPTPVPGMPTPTPAPAEGEVVEEEPTPAVTLIIPLTPPVEVPPTATSAPELPGGGTGQYYTVQPNDSLFSIAVRFGTTIEEIMEANDMTDDLLSVGQELLIPVPAPTPIPTAAAPIAGEPADVEPAPIVDVGPAPPLEAGNIYVVQAGDNLFRIALKYNVSMDAIAEANHIVPPWYVIYSGQRLVIPQ